MSDLIERLREPFPDMHHDTPSEAADEIERLEKSRREYRKTITGLEAEIARKDEALDRIERWSDGVDELNRDAHYMAKIARGALDQDNRCDQCGGEWDADEDCCDACGFCGYRIVETAPTHQEQDQDND